MASHDQIRQYIAYWFQLGKKVLIKNGQEAIKPQFVLSRDRGRYSQEFEDCWLKILSPDSGECYLEGTEETIEELLQPQWEVDSCARCSMPIPSRVRGMPPDCCPCFDLPNWPDTQTPLPRSPISNTAHLVSICERLVRVNQEQDSDSYNHNSKDLEEFRAS